jgi:hypothetical protein
MEESLGIPSVYRKVNSKESLFKYLRNMDKYRRGKLKNYGILYMAFHGEKNTIWLDNEEYLTLEELCENTNTLLKDRIIHFGTCQTLKIDQESLEKFLKDSGARAVSGYRKKVPFIESSVFDIAYLSKLTEYDKPGFIDSFIKNYLQDLADSLGFIYFDKRKNDPSRTQ